ncbi:MAG: thiolase family protein [Proteobacteria bacterium]|nr:thiolase family protein [Pseudomonadota bacterium]
MPAKYPSHSQRGNKRPVIVDGSRSAFVKSFGVFAECDSLELYSRVVSGLLQKTGIDPEVLEEISCGVVIPQTKNGNVARDTIINLNLPAHIHGYTLNRACTSSMQTIADAARSISAGHGQLILAGGVECLSDVPIVYSKEARRFLLKLNKAKSPAQRLAMLSEFSIGAWVPKPPSLSEPLTGLSMGEHTEIMAKKNEISRSDQDAFAVLSHKRAGLAQAAGYLAEEIVPIWAPPKYEGCIEKDNVIRDDTTTEALARIKPAFDKKFGTITAGNASPLTDGAAVCLIADELRAKSLDLKPKAYINDVLFVGVNPHDQLLIGPAVAIPLILKRNGLSLQDIGLFEIHEAFAAQVLSCIRAMDNKSFCQEYFGDASAFGLVPEDKLNINGGAIAIGHPFGATGARLAMSLANSLQRTNQRFGIIGICAQGGIAGAMLLERADT